MNDILFLPVKPKWAGLIMSGQKTLELRKRLPANNMAKRCVIYSSSPKCEVIGTCTIVSRIYGLLRGRGMSLETGLRLVPNNDIDAACVSRKEFAAYFGDRAEWFGLVLANAAAFTKPVPLETLRKHWHIEPPQQWRYIDRKTFDEIVEAGR